MKGKKNPRVARFLGNGNVFVDGRRMHGWEVKCSRCSQSKVIGSAGSQSLPPEIILKKLTQAGWLIGNKPQDDICDACQRKTVASRIDVAKKALAFAAAPIVPNGNGSVMHFSELMALAMKLELEQKRQLIKALRESLPQPAHKPKAPKTPVESDPEYAQWLERQ